MRKKCLFFLLCMITTVVAFAGKESQYVLYEGFENGMPATWTQEYATGMQVPWAVEQSGASEYPAQAFKGSSLVALRNTTGQTQHFATKLVTPIIDLTDVFQPIVVFSHAQMQYAGDVDALYVYYRTSASARWVQLGKYENKTNGWKTDTIELTSPSATYQLAFEGVDNMGRGIALDEVIVRPTPTCDNPSYIAVDGLTANTATLRWVGSLDTDSFRVVLTTSAQTDPENLTDVVKDEYVYDYQWSTDGLERNTQYYFYIQANCGGAESEIASYTFRTKNLSDVPYVETFNKNYVQGIITHVDYWTHGTSIMKDDGSMAFPPFINQATTESNWANYSYSKSSCLVFTGANNLTTAIPAGHYVYAATPEMNVPSVSTLQATFWGTCYQSVGDDYMSGLIVGVMTDPADFSTFVPVDTVYAPNSQTFDRFTISFDNYKGEGKYIAFASNFMEKDNIFYMDEVTITEAPALRGLSNVTISNCKGARFDVNAQMNGNSQVQLIVTRDTLNEKGSVWFDPTELPESIYLVNKTLSASELPYTVQLPKGGQFVQVYMRPTDGTNYGEFALPVKVQVPMLLEESVTITFEKNEPGTNYWTPQQLSNFSVSSNSTSYPFAVLTSPQNFCNTNPSYPGVTSTSNYGYNSNSCMYIGKELQEFSDGNIRCAQEVGDYIALPEALDIKGTILEFYMRGYSDATKGTARVAIGVMTDPLDITTFDTIAICEELNSVYKPFLVTFGDYKGKGTFPAIMAVDAQVRYKYSSTSGSGGSYTTYKTSYARIDDISLYPMGDCVMPTSVKDEAIHNQVDITWVANGMNQWLVSLYSDEACTVKVDSAIVNVNKCTFTGLEPITTYYYTVATICGEEITKAIPYEFTTICLPAQPLPYFEGFENWTGGSSNREVEPVCWTMEKIAYTYSSDEGTTYYPYISSTYANSGSKSFYFTLSSAATYAKQDFYAALPLMADTIQELQMQFYVKASAGKKLYVGVMSDPNDVSTFDTVQVCQLTSGDFTEFIVRFDTYAGKGEYIAFLQPLDKLTASDWFYIDDIKVDYLSECEKIQGVSARNASNSGADIYWQKGTATTWNVVVTSKPMELGSTVEVDSIDVISLDTTTTMPFRVTSCPEMNVEYYAYVRAVCDGSVGEWSRPVAFKTICAPVSVGDLGLIDFTAKDVLDCWTVGVRQGTTAVPSRNTNSYLYMFNTAASDGAYAIMPPLDIDSINRLQISFDAHGGNGAAYLRELTVGVISNPSDLSTFVAVKKISLNKVSAANATTNYGFDEAARYTIRFDEYYGDYNGDFGKQIMFISESGDLANYIYIKNILVDTLPACLEPVEVEVVNTNTYDATLAWEEGGTNYQVQLLADDKQTVVADTLVTANTVQVTGLEMLTTYYAQVRQICAVGDTSVWSNLVKLTTTCPTVFPLPYSEDFDKYASGAGNLPNCWEGFAVGSTTKYPYVNSSAKKDGKNGFYLYRTTSISSYAVLPPFNAPISDLMLSFDYRNYSTSNKAYFIVGVATDVTSAEGIDSTLTVIDSVEVAAYKAPDNVWHYYSNTLDAYTGQGGYLVLVAPKADKTANNGYLYLDNLYIEKAPTCFRPINFQMLTASTSSVTLSWTPYGKETAWDVAYVAAGGKIEDATVVTVDSTVATIAALQHSTDYDFYVRANCGDGEVSNWTDPLTINTLYLVELADANWNFDDYTTQYQSPLNTGATYKNEKGWLVGNKKAPTTVGNVPYNRKNTYNSTSGTITNHYAKSDSCAMYIASTSANDGAYAIMPEINANYDSLQLRFFGRAIYATGSKVENRDSVYYNAYSKGTYKHAVMIGTVTDPYDLSTFELLLDYTFKTIEDTDKTIIVEDGHWEEVAVPLYGAKGKYIVFLSEYGATNYVNIDDVVVEKETGCATPTALTVDSLTATTAKISWKSSKSQWKVQAIATENDSIVDEAVVTAPTWTTNALEQVTEYKLVVTAICGDNDFSKPNQVMITTPCLPVANYEDFVVDFETNLVQLAVANQVPECWDAGQLVVGGTSTSYVPKAMSNTANYQYSRNRKETNTEAAALRLYNYSTSYTDSYVVLPEMNFDMDSVSLHFWARVGYYFTNTYSTEKSRNRLYGAINKYQRTIVIGAVADIEDLSTFVPLDTFEYSQSFDNTNVYSYNDPAGNEYWEEVLIPLKDYEGKGRIAILYPSNGTTSYFFIDDMEVVPGDFCTAATNLRASNIGSTSATLNWVTLGNDSVRLQLATSEDFENTNPLIDTILVNAGGTYEAANLKSGQEYYFRVQHFCAEEEIADWSITSRFVTDYAVRFFEDFEELTTYPANWARANNLPSDVFSGAKEINYVAETVTANWSRTLDCNFASSAIRSQASTGTSSSSISQYWLITPIIDMPDTITGQAMMLSFQMGLSGSGGGMTTPSVPQEDDKFIVAVSEDGGKTWSADNTTWWSDDVDDNAAYSYAQIPATGKLYTVDFSKYAGKRIQVAFINYSEKTASKNYIYLANVSINGVVIENYPSTICQWQDYKDDNFSIDAYDLLPGEVVVYDFYNQATKANELDKSATLTLNVLNESRTTFNATVCEGESYTLDNFNIQNATASNVYKQKLEGVNTCDSVVVLNLTVLPRLRTEVTQTICQGDYYEFNGVKYYTNTVKTDTLKSVVSGCDSIVSLYLTVNAMLSGEEEAHLCPGEFVEFGKFGQITEAGTYIDTIKNALMCDSAAVLKVYTHKNEATTVRGLICRGEKYDNDVWAGLTQAGDYPSKQETVWGCDSIVTLHLMVADGSLEVYDEISSEELPYVLNGYELLPVGTAPGTYSRIVDINCGTATVVITVDKASGFNNVYCNSLALAPNLVGVGQETAVLGMFAENAILEVYHTTGALVYRSANTSVVPGMPAAGVYMVTVKSNNQLYQSTLIVQ